ncbi:MAG: ribonuclease H-like domain-containing protein [Myxococcales bacterium]
MARALSACARSLSVLALDPALAEVDFTRALYIDTETTGLLGGTGTLPFLIGCARFELGSLVVEQLLLERPGHEGPMLRRLAELLAQASCIVSFNGKSFDWPLLRTRFIMNRVPAPKVPAHLDLLHCARRVYKRRLGSVRLIELEAAVLGFERIEDLPGELIPETYLGFLRGRTPGAALWPVVEHNRSDLVALPAMLGELVRRFAEPSAPELRQDARDQLGFAQVAARADDPQRALAFAQAAAESDVRGELAPEAMYLAGMLKLKVGDLAGAVCAFRDSLEASHGRAEASARAHLALAKMFEHRLKDPERAFFHAPHTGLAEGNEASARRVQRLQKKWQRCLGAASAEGTADVLRGGLLEKIVE